MLGKLPFGLYICNCLKYIVVKNGKKMGVNAFRKFGNHPKAGW